MKGTFLILLAFLTACGSPPQESLRLLESNADSLETINARAYTPDFDELMIDIQIHHSKLWLAGSHQNWPLAGYQVKKIKESINDLVKYQSQRKEIAILGMLDRSVDSVGVAIQKKDPAQFTVTFDYLTNTCNICHRSYDVGFNVIRTPKSSPFTNQEFQPIE